jgi:Ca2+-binding RTX toxin-like protein
MTKIRKARVQLLGVGAMLVVAVGAGGCTRQFDLFDVQSDGLPVVNAKVDARIAGQVLKVDGTNKDDKLTLRLRAGDANVLEVDAGDDGSADFSFSRTLFNEINVKARNGNDLVRVVDEANLPIDEPTSIFGENGNDTLLGGSAIETIDGGNGDDFIDGNRANDTAFMGNGNDTFRWDPGDASDVVEGQGGSDTLLFNGANGGETVDLSANGKRFTFSRQPGNITMDTDDVEISVFNALGGPDNVTVNDLTGTDVRQVALNLEAGQGSGAGDGVQDGVVVNGTAGSDAIVVTGGAGSVNVMGLSAVVTMTATDAAHDLLIVNAAGGNDSVDASGLQADALQRLTIDGEGGSDLILGGRGADVLIGGAPVMGADGGDFIDGNQGGDIALMGAGDDTFVWDPGDGSDVVEGEGGSDTLLFNGAGGDEEVTLSANGGRFKFFRVQANITMDVDDVETSVFNALGGKDTITVNDLTGTDVTQVELNLENPLGSGVGDGAADQVTINGTAGDDDIAVKGSAGSVDVTGLSAAVAISNAEFANDRLDINTAEGNDTVDTSGLAAGVIQLFVNVPV